MSQITMVFQDLVRVETFLWNAVEARLVGECQLPLGRFQVLLTIDRLGSCRVGDIAEELAITWGGTSKLVDRLEAGALCRRRPNPGDKRSSLIDLTPAGERILATAQAAVDAELHDLVGTVVSPQTLSSLGLALAELRGRIDGPLQEQTA